MTYTAVIKTTRSTAHVCGMTSQYLYEVFLRSDRCCRRSCSGGLVPGSGDSQPFDGDQSCTASLGGTSKLITPVLGLIYLRVPGSRVTYCHDVSARHRRPLL